jgi:hypothetical protein
MLRIAQKLVGKPFVDRLYDGILRKIISSSASIYAIEGDVYDLIYDELEMRHIVAQNERDSLWLCIYSYDLSDSTDERRFLSCAAVRFPKAKTEPGTDTPK